MIELLKAGHIDIGELKKESKNSIQDDREIDFELNKTILALVEEDKRFSRIREIDINKLFDETPVKIYDARTEKGYVKTVICSNIEFKLN
jgi:hypothetical protein